MIPPTSGATCRWPVTVQSRTAAQFSLIQRSRHWVKAWVCAPGPSCPVSVVPTPPVASTVRSSRKESPPRVQLSAKSAVADQLPLRPGLAGLARVRRRTADNLARHHRPVPERPRLSAALCCSRQEHGLQADSRVVHALFRPAYLGCPPRFLAAIRYSSAISVGPLTICPLPINSCMSASGIHSTRSASVQSVGTPI